MLHPYDFFVDAGPSFHSFAHSLGVRYCTMTAIVKSLVGFPAWPQFGISRIRGSCIKLQAIRLMQESEANSNGMS